jgi:hypothetical protein
MGSLPWPPSQICGHALNRTSDISLEKVVGTAPDLTDMCKDAETSLRKSDGLGDRAAVYLVIDRSCLMKNYFTDGTVQRWSDRILSLSAHLDDDGKVPVGAASSPAESTLTRGVLFRRSQSFVDVALGAHLGRIAELHTPRGTPNTAVALVE